jgi:hypothetical protein
MASAISRTARTRAYLAAVILVLLASFASALGSATGYSPSRGPVDTPVLVLGGLAAAVIALRWLRPDGPQYALGSLCLSIAVMATWANTPTGARWLATTLHTPPSALPMPEVIHLLPLLFLPAWVLLGASIGSWKAGLTSYIAAGLIFTLAVGAVETRVWGAGDFGLGSDPMPNLTIAVLLWPVRLLVMLGTFGNTFGSIGPTP